MSTEHNPAATSTPEVQPPTEERNGRIQIGQIDERVREDWLWVFEQYNTGVWMQYYGQTIAVVGKQIQGVSRNPGLLELEVCTRLGIPREKLVLFYVD